MTDVETPPPNHHASLPGFAGPRGAAMALRFSLRRGRDSDLFRELTATGPGDRVLDIGCGPGAAVRRAVARGADHAIGVDPAPVMLRTARLLTLPSRHRGRIAYRIGTAESLPVDDEAVTVAWSVATVHHWDDLTQGLAEVVRVLRPGGRFLAVERNVDPTAGGVAGHGWSEGQAEAFADLCRAAGFPDVELGRHPSRRGPLLTVLARLAPDPAVSVSDNARPGRMC